MEQFELAKVLVWPLLALLLCISTCSDLVQSVNPNISHEWSTALLLRGIMLVNFIACMSVYVQADGLSSPVGLIPLSRSLRKQHHFVIQMHEKEKTAGKPMSLPQQLGKAMVIISLRLFGLKIVNSVSKLSLSCMISASLGLVFIPHSFLFFYVYFCYSSIRRALPEFFNLQWDALLLECNFFGAILALADSTAGASTLSALCAAAARAPFKLLLFRLMFGSGVVKLTSGDSSWLDLSAMSYHFLTQPLPGRLAPYFHALPIAILKLMSFHALWISEVAIPLLSLLAPLLVSFRSGISIICFVSYIALQASITLGGNYGFFNALSAVLAITLLQDSDVTALLQPVLVAIDRNRGAVETLNGEVVRLIDGPFRFALNFGIILCSCLCVVVNVVAIFNLLQRSQVIPSAHQSGVPIPDGGVEEKVAKIIRSLLNHAHNCTIVCIQQLQFMHSCGSALGLGGHYGLFATMTKFRDEIVLEVSDDYEDRVNSAIETEKLTAQSQSPGAGAKGQCSDKNAAASSRCNSLLQAEVTSTWHPVEFAFKPGSGASSLSYSGPSKSGFNSYKALWPPLHMPRLDWQLWFLPLKRPLRTMANAATHSIKEMEKDASATIASENIILNKLRVQVASVLPRWLLVLMTGILEGDPTLLSLLHPHLNDTLYSPIVNLDVSKTKVINELQIASTPRNIRVRMIKYAFSTSEKQGVWETSEVRYLMPPTSLSTLFKLVDVLFEEEVNEEGSTAKKPLSTLTGTAAASFWGDKRSKLARVPEQLRPETAAELIQRRLFKKRDK